MPEHLRSVCLEAMADEFRACMAGDELLDRIPVRLFDRALAVLGERADEWSAQAVRRHPFGKGPVSTPKTVIQHAIVVLEE